MTRPRSQKHSLLELLLRHGIDKLCVYRSRRAAPAVTFRRWQLYLEGPQLIATPELADEDENIASA